MKILRAYKTELDPNNVQSSFFGRCCGASRYVYNWGLAEWERRYAAGEKTGHMTICAHFNAVKDEVCPWIREVPYSITESAFRNLGAAFTRYFKEKKDGTVAKRIAKLKESGKWDTHVARLCKKGRKGYQLDPGYPQFKARGQDSSFQLRGYRTDTDKVWPGRNVGWIRLKEKGYVPTGVAYKENGGAVYATISERAGRWFISVQVEEEVSDPVNDNTLVVGVDFGIHRLAMCSDGTAFENPKPLRQAQRQLGRLNRELARREKYGSNWRKTKRKIARCHAKVANIREHTLHQISHELVVERRPTVIVIENLNVSGMTKNHHLAQAISDCGFHELRRQIEYKAGWHGIEVVVVDRWYPSSKVCSGCGCIKEDLTMADRTFKCSDCGLEIDRDYNAALNLKTIGEQAVVSRETHGACLGSQVAVRTCDELETRPSLTTT